MGCVTSREDPFLEDRLLNDAIEQSLHLNRVQQKNEVRLLLLGAGESGKSTVLKQLRLLHKGGFSQQERLQYAQVIWADVIQLMKTLIINARKLGITLDCDSEASDLSEHKRIVLQANALDHIDTGAAGGASFLNEYVIKYSESNKSKRHMVSTGVASTWSDANNEYTDQEIAQGLMEIGGHSQLVSRTQVAEAITNLWEFDSGIRQCFNRANEFQLETNAAYHFDNIMKFSDPNYLCSDMDILKGRIKTTGITETSFHIRNCKFKVLDTGGQRSERKKWIHCFENITAVLFVLAISEYDQKLFEDERVNRMHEAILLFDTLCHSRWFINTPFILFLNKIDLFETKLVQSPLKKYFPDYEGKLDVNEAINYFENKFLGLNRLKKPIYVHRTCATDSQSMRFVLSAVTDMIIQQNLKKSGII